MCRRCIKPVSWPHVLITRDEAYQDYYADKHAARDSDMEFCICGSEIDSLVEGNYEVLFCSDTRNEIERYRVEED